LAWRYAGPSGSLGGGPESWDPGIPSSSLVRGSPVMVPTQALALIENAMKSVRPRSGRDDAAVSTV